MKFKSIRTVVFLVNLIVILVCVPILVMMDYRIHHERTDSAAYFLHFDTEVDTLSSGGIDAVVLLEEHLPCKVTPGIRDYKIIDGDNAYDGTLVFYLVDASRPDGQRYSRLSPGNNKLYIYIETCLAIYTVAVDILSDRVASIAIVETVYADTHIWSDRTVYTRPTCTDEGIEMQYCMHPDCPFYYFTPIAANGHTPGEKTIVYEPTCTENGRWEIRCVICNQLLDYGTVDALAHEFHLLQINDIWLQSCVRCDLMFEYDVPDVTTTGHSMFSDTYGHWAYESIMLAAMSGHMQGVGNEHFAPDAQISRAMVATILWRLAGEPGVTFSPVFSDVAPDRWYSEAIIWASQSGIVHGLGDGRFSPHENITMEQFAAMFYRYAVFVDTEVDADADTDIADLCYPYDYADHAQIDDKTSVYMNWANYVELITDVEDSTVSPLDTITRAQTAIALHHFITNVTGDNFPETDLPCYTYGDNT